MAEFMDEDTTDEYFNLLDVGVNFDGARYLEYVCSAFFGKTLRCTERSRRDPMVKNYELFSRDSSFFYGIA